MRAAYIQMKTKHIYITNRSLPQMKFIPKFWGQSLKKSPWSKHNKSSQQPSESTMNLMSKLLVEECKPELWSPGCNAGSIATGPSVGPLERLGESKISEDGVLGVRLLRTSSSHSCLFGINGEDGRVSSCVTLDVFDPKLIIEGSAELEATIKLVTMFGSLQQCCPV